ncbi:MAG: peptide chain release factor N(5)-glutamine methyltransferase [Calditrichaeota bacterium]|nr:peptide chain release factor N(5)-glutamine methyltransferase [Calditrichota bacterium]
MTSGNSVISIYAIPGSIGAALMEGEQRLRYADVIRPRRHAELLLEKALGQDRTGLYLSAGESIPALVYEKFIEFLRRREAGEPVQYIVGWAPFFGRKFIVGEGVFIPRFETETLIERLLADYSINRQHKETIEILDLCSGCGIIGLSAAVEIANAKVTLVDSSKTALQYIKINAEALKVENQVEFIEADARNTFPVSWNRRYQYVLANPPYIPENEIHTLPPDVRNGEPKQALTDGGDGLSFYRRWMQTIPPVLREEGKLFIECSDGKASVVANVLSTAFDELIISKDLSDIERVVEGVVRDYSSVR